MLAGTECAATCISKYWHCQVGRDATKLQCRYFRKPEEGLLVDSGNLVAVEVGLADVGHVNEDTIWLRQNRCQNRTTDDEPTARQATCYQVGSI